MKRAIDIIGDVHGRRSALGRLLSRLGWEDVDHRPRHPEGRLLVSIGDVLNKGEDPLGCLEILERAHEAGDALMILGNHEANALHYMAGMRPKTPGTTRQFQATLDQIEADPERWERAAAFIRKLPLTLELDEGRLRCVHACWPAPDLPTPPIRLATAADLRRSGEGGELQAALLHCIKGPEESCAPYHDRDGIPRHRDRIAWWETHPAEAPMTVFGHYCFPWPHRPEIPAEPSFLGPGRNAACLDFGAGRGDRLAALRWPEREFVVEKV